MTDKTNLPPSKRWPGEHAMHLKLYRPKEGAKLHSRVGVETRLNADVAEFLLHLGFHQALELPVDPELKEKLQALHDCIKSRLDDKQIAPKEP